VNRYEALKHAVKAHAGQVDKCGQPYILHPIAVAEVFTEKPSTWHLYGQGRPTWGDAEVVALLHDVLEDTDYDLPSIALNAEQRAGLKAITKPPTDTYAEYIERVCADPVALIVKLADLWDNTRPERLGCLPLKEAQSLERRYLKARDRIWQALGHDWWPSDD
jgi:(p)ppGpp synthase/HD superfamily hydrolase